VCVSETCSNIHVRKNLCGCETFLSLTLKEEHRFRLIENRVLMRMCGSKRLEVAEAGQD